MVTYRATTSLIAAVVLAATALVFVPTAEAEELYCSAVKNPCDWRGDLVCLLPHRPTLTVCVADPCDTTHCFPATASAIELYCSEVKNPCDNYREVACVLPDSAAEVCVTNNCGVAGCDPTLTSTAAAVTVYCSAVKSPCDDPRDLVCVLPDSGAETCVTHQCGIAGCDPYIPSAQCVAVAGVGPAGAECTVDGKTVGAITCRYCYPTFYAWASAGTEGVTYGTHGLDGSAATVLP